MRRWRGAWPSTLRSVLEGRMPSHCVEPDFGVGRCPAPLTESVPQRIKTVAKADVNRVVAEIRERAPNAWILLVGYPRLLKEGSDLSVAVPGVYGLSPDEVAFLNDMARVAATELLPADMEHKVAAIDVRTYFEGHHELPLVLRGRCGGGPDRSF